METIQQVVLRPFKAHSPFARYFVVFASVLAIVLLRSLLHPILGSSSRYIFFLLAVLVSAWYSGKFPALIALILGAVLGNLFFAIPYSGFGFSNPSDLFSVIIYLVIGLAIIALFEIVKRNEARLAATISKQSQVEDALRKSEERFRLATEALKGVVYDWDADTDVAYRSSGLYEILGYHLDEIVGNRKWWQAQIHPDDLERVLQAHQRSVTAKSPTHSVEYRVRHKDGHYLWVWDNARMVFNAEGKLIRLVGNTLSIDESKHLNDVLQQTEERFRVAFENASDAMVMSDKDGIVVVANDAYSRLYGYTQDEVVGQRFEIIFPEQFRQMAREEYQRVFQTPGQLPFSESVVMRKDGVKRTVEARPGFVEQQGQRVYMLSIIRDLTDRKQTEKDLYTRYQFTSRLAQANSVQEVGKITIDQLIAYLDAPVGNIFVYLPEDNTFQLLYASASPYADRFESWQRFTANPGYPLTDVVHNNKALWFSTADEWHAAYPVMAAFSSPDLGATVHLPLVAASEVFGAISLVFSEPRVFTEPQREFITSLVFQAAQAIERARLAENARDLAVMQERHRLARDLHDNVSQLLFSSSVMSEMLPRSLVTKPEKAVQQAEQLNLMVRGAMAEMRTLLWELRPESIIQTPLSNLLMQISYAIRARQEAEISVTIRVDNEYLLPPEAQVAFYRIAQESVHNVLKHAEAEAISVVLRQTERYTALFVVDDGKGFDSQANSGGLGMKNMSERAASVGAQLSVKSQIGKGTRLRLLWVKPPADTDDHQSAIKNPDATPTV